MAHILYRYIKQELFTYNPPTAKIPPRACFCLFARFKLRMTGIGKIIMTKSVRMLIAALVNHIANWLIHFAGSLVQNARTGTHANMLPVTVQTV